MIHPLTGETLIRDVRPVIVTYAGLEETVQQPGWYPRYGGEAVYDAADLRAYSDAWSRLAARAHGPKTEGQIPPTGWDNTPTREASASPKTAFE
jgi:hypothetical protein